jgi:hypothetical protein
MYKSDATPTRSIRWARRVDALTQPSADAVVVSIVGECSSMDKHFYDTPQRTRELFAVLHRGDIAITTLRGVWSDCAIPTRLTPNLIPVYSLDALQIAGIRVASLATDVALDAGASGVHQTINGLRGRGISPTGVKLSRDGPEEVFSQVVRDTRVTVLGLRCSERWGDECRSQDGKVVYPHVSSLRLKRVVTGEQPEPASVWPISADLRDCESLCRAARRPGGIAVVLVSTEDNVVGLPDFLSLIAKRLSSAGADILVFTGTGCDQRIERLGRTLVFFGLGSFIGMERHLAEAEMERPARPGMILRIAIINGAVSGAELVPYVLGDDGWPRAATDPQARAALERIREITQPDCGFDDSPLWYARL